MIVALFYWSSGRNYLIFIFFFYNAFQDDVFDEVSLAKIMDKVSFMKVTDSMDMVKGSFVNFVLTICAAPGQEEISFF